MCLWVAPLLYPMERSSGGGRRGACGTPPACCAGGRCLLGGPGWRRGWQLHSGVRWICSFSLGAGDCFHNPFLCPSIHLHRQHPATYPPSYHAHHFTRAHNRLLVFLYSLQKLLLIGGIEPNPGPTNKKLIISHCNINSITASDRIDELSQFVNINNIDILCLTETKLDQNVHPSLYIPPPGIL